MLTDFINVSLDDLLDEWDREAVEALLKTFKCELDPEMEEFLTKKAIRFHDKHLSRTYLFLSDDMKKVRAYLTLGIKCLKVPKNSKLSNKVKKEMAIHNDVSQSYLIGQLCKADGVEKGIGPELIEFALSIFDKSFKTVGCRTVRIDCKKDLIEFYEKNKFHLVSQEKDDGDLYHMVLLL